MGDGDDEALGVTPQEFASPQNEVNVSDTGYGDPNDLNNPPLGPANMLNPSAAWIRTPNHPTQGTPSKGTMLAAFTRRAQHPVTQAWSSDAVWAHSSTWTLGSATYTELRANEWDPVRGRHRWPAPSNLCRYFENFAECGVGSLSWNDQNLHHWSEPAAALWTGLDRTAAIVTTGGPDAALPNEAVFVVTSNDGGLSFQRSLIVSIEEAGPHTMPEFDAEDAVGSGGNIISGSVHASLANFGERTSPLAGRVSLPIYIVWQHQPDYADPEWWWTRVEVGESGYIAQTTPPRRLPSFVPREPGVQVSIFGYRIDGEERVGIAWAEREDQDVPNACTKANTNVDVTWYASSTADLGDTWGCFMGNEPTVTVGGTTLPIFDGCSGGKTTIAAVPNWPTCARVHATSPMPNSVRPEVAMNAPARNDGNGIDEDPVYRYWYFALTMPRSTGSTASTSKVCVYRTGAVEYPVPGAPAQDHADILPLGCTTSADPSDRVLAQAYAPAIAVAQGTTDGPRVEVTYRSLLREGNVGRQDVMTLEHTLFPSQTPAPDFDHLATVDFPLRVGLWGTRSGLAVYEKCDRFNPACPSDGNYSSSDAGFAGAWSDTRRVLNPRVTDTFIRSFEWE